MNNSLRHTHSSIKEEPVRLCDYCSNSKAVLYCRADSARLCLSCDREVHSTNQLFSKHTRSLICDACDDSHATILCSTESSVFCQNCDWEKHNLSLSSVHERRPIEGFTGCPSVTEFLSIVGLQDIGKKSFLSLDRESGVSGDDGFLGNNNEIDGFSDFFVWDTPSFVSLDDLISSSGASHNYRAMEVPPLPKNRKAACGRHKEEILRQLRELLKSESFNPEKYLQPSKTDDEVLVPSPYEWLRESSEPMYQIVPPETSFNAYTEEVEVKHSTSVYVETHTNGKNEGTASKSLRSETLSTTTTTPPKPVPAPYDLASQERDSALQRYKQKKKTRRYDKHIRYESRKARAESRTRVKGRFAKMEH